MMLDRQAAFTAMVLVLVPVKAWARDFLYPWKAGTTLQAVSSDQQQCLVQAKAAEDRENRDEQARRRGQPAPPPPANSKAWLAPGIDAQTAMFNRFYDCLRERGYSIRRMPSTEYGKAKKAGGMAVMQAMIAPATPHSEVPVGVIK